MAEVIQSGEPVCCVWVDFTSSSLSEAGWSRHICGTSLLEYCCSGLLRATGWPLVLIAVPGDPEPTRVAASCGATVYPAASRSLPSAVAEVAVELGVGRMLIAHGLLGLGLIPHQFINSLSSRHVDSKADATIASGLPAPLYAFVCESGLLRTVRELSKSVALPDDLSQLLRVLAQSSGADNSGPRLRLREESWLAYPGVNAREIPKQIPWVFPPDLARVENAIRDPDPGELGALKAVKRLTVEAFDRANRRRSVPRQTSRTGLRILYASNPSAYSGSEQSLINTVQSLNGADLQVHCLVAMEGVFSDGLRTAGAVVHCPSHDFAASTVPNFLEVDQVLERIRPDIIHCNSIVGAPLLTLSRLRGIPLVQWARVVTLDALSAHLIAADRITAVSRFIADRACEDLIRPDKVRVVYDAVDCQRFSPEVRPPRDARRDLRIAPEEFLVICVARFAPYKRHDILAHAVAQVRRDFRHVRLILVGEPEPGHESYYVSFIRLLRDLNLLGSTTILGFQRDVLSLEAAADTVVLCSEQEPLGTVVLESMALGRPVVVAASGGLPEMIEDNLSGLHVVPGDATSLARQLRRLLETPALARELGQNARARAVELFSPQVHAKHLLEVYQELLSQIGFAKESGAVGPHNLAL